MAEEPLPPEGAVPPAERPPPGSGAVLAALAGALAGAVLQVVRWAVAGRPGGLEDALLSGLGWGAVLGSGLGQLAALVVGRGQGRGLGVNLALGALVGAAAGALLLPALTGVMVLVVPTLIDGQAAGVRDPPSLLVGVAMWGALTGVAAGPVAVWWSQRLKAN